MEAAIGPRPMADARVGQQDTLTQVWARRGTRPRAPRDTRYQWAYIFDAVCPGRGVATGLVMPFADTGAKNEHLAEISPTVTPDAHAVLVLDGAGWHGGHALVVPGNVSLVVLPPYSPELNPLKTSGSICEPTGSQSASSTTTTPSSMPAAPRGTASQRAPKQSPP